MNSEQSKFKNDKKEVNHMSNCKLFVKDQISDIKSQVN